MIECKLEYYAAPQNSVQIKSASIPETTGVRFSSLCEREEHGRKESHVNRVGMENREMNVDMMRTWDNSLVVIDRP